MDNEANIYRWKNITPLALYAHQQAVAKGFWKEPYHEDHYLMLVVTELSEAVEADRKGLWTHLDLEDLDTLDQYDGEVFAEEFVKMVKDTVEDEIADACIRLLDLLGSKATEDDYMWTLDVEPPFEGRTLTQMLFRVCQSLHEDKPLNYPISLLRAVSNYYGFNLMKHIELKMKYNTTRPALHGKKY